MSKNKPAVVKKQIVAMKMAATPKKGMMEANPKTETPFNKVKEKANMMMLKKKV